MKLIRRKASGVIQIACITPDAFLRETYPEKSIWCYTGYLYDVDLIPSGKVFTEVTQEMLSYIDTLVDGEFIEEEKDLSLKFRGSRNQRIIHLHEE